MMMRDPLYVDQLVDPIGHIDMKTGEVTIQRTTLSRRVSEQQQRLQDPLDIVPLQVSDAEQDLVSIVNNTDEQIMRSIIGEPFASDSRQTQPPELPSGPVSNSEDEHLT